MGSSPNRLAVTLYRDIRQAFRWAEQRQPWRRLLMEGNPAELLRIETIVDPQYDLSNERSRVLNAGEIAELRSIFSRMTLDYDHAADKRKAPRRPWCSSSEQRRKARRQRQFVAAFFFIDPRPCGGGGSLTRIVFPRERLEVEKSLRP
jgi:hypothetical protein